MECEFFSFMVSGCTKFNSYYLFMQIRHSFYRKDVFEANELLKVIGACRVATVKFSLKDVRKWKHSLAQMYNNN